MKNKYNDNRLAEEFDLIVLLDDKHKLNGLSRGDLGTLTYSYTGADKPMYAEFAFADGSKREEPVFLQDFRVLNERDRHDLSLIVQYMKNRSVKNA